MPRDIEERSIAKSSEKGMSDKLGPKPKKYLQSCFETLGCQMETNTMDSNKFGMNMKRS